MFSFHFEPLKIRYMIIRIDKRFQFQLNVPLPILIVDIRTNALVDGKELVNLSRRTAGLSCSLLDSLAMVFRFLN